MKKIALKDGWQMRICGQDAWLSASVPCSLVSVLLEHKEMADPFWRCNEETALELCRKDCEFRTEVVLTEDFLRQRRVELLCEGLDTLADIFVNGTLLAQTADMHRTYRLDCRALLHAGKNELLLHFHSSLQFVETAHATPGKESDVVPAGSHCGGHFLRKAQSMFGWDWGIDLPDMGIWRDISLVGWQEPLLEDVRIRQQHTAGEVKLAVEVQCEQKMAADCTLAFRLLSPEGETLDAQQQPCAAHTVFASAVRQPRLWWPNGYGEHPLYQVELCLLQGSQTCQTQTYSIGLRTLTVLHEPDEWGKSFAVCVNGLQIFTRGANYIPEDAVYPRITPQAQEKLLRLALEENMNCLRVWGGGYYPSDVFYDLCDHMGLLVWQDLMFADDVYDMTPEFEANILAETRDNVRRLRHHASLLLWCGNNEIESAWSHWPDFQRQSPALRADYIKMFEYLLPRVLKENDDQTFFWPSTPSSGGNIDRPDDENDGDVHYWDVWHGRKPFTDYRKYQFRFCSEFGFQSFPSMKTIAAFTEPQDRNPFTRVMECHQKNDAANGVILAYISQNFRYPANMAGLVYLSQVLQGMAIQYGVDHWRRNRGRCMGSLFWQMNDNWPVASWSSVDYFGRRKALHYMARRFYAPVAGSLLREGSMVSAYVQNETAQVRTCTAVLRLRAVSGEVLDETAFTEDVLPFSAACLGQRDYAALLPEYKYTAVAEIAFSGEELADVVTEPFVPYKHLELQHPHITTRVEKALGGWQVTLQADCWAPFVWLDLKDGDGAFSDNCFALNGRDSRKVFLWEDSLCLPEGQTVAEQLTVTCLQDSYMK